MTTPYDTYKNAVLGVPFNPNKKPSMKGTVLAFAQMQTQLEAAQSGALVKDTLAHLNDLTEAPYANIMAWVTNDTTNSKNGIYENAGTSTSPNFVKRASIPQFIVTGIHTGNGTNNELEVFTDMALPAEDGRCVIIVPVIADNTGSVTININEETTLNVVKSSNLPLSNGDIVAGMNLIGVISGSNFVLISDIVSENTAIRAEAAATTAAAALSGVNNVVGKYKTITEFTAGIETFRGNGQVWEIAGNRYEEIPNASSDPDLVNSVGVFLHALELSSGGWKPEQFGEITGVDDHIEVNKAMQKAKFAKCKAVTLSQSYSCGDSVLWPSKVNLTCLAGNSLNRQAGSNYTGIFDGVLKSENFDEHFNGMISGSDVVPKGDEDEDVHIGFSTIGWLVVNGSRFVDNNPENLTTKHNVLIYGKTTLNFWLLTTHSGGDGLFWTCGTPFTNDNFNDEPVASGIRVQSHQHGRDGVTITGPNDARFDEFNITRCGRNNLNVYDIDRINYVEVVSVNNLWQQGETVYQNSSGCFGILVYADEALNRLYYVPIDPDILMSDTGTVLGYESERASNAVSIGVDGFKNLSNSKCGINSVHVVGGGNGQGNGAVGSTGHIDAYCILNIGGWLYGDTILAETGLSKQVMLWAPKNNAIVKSTKVWKSSSKNPNYTGPIATVRGSNSDFGHCFVENDGTSNNAKGLHIVGNNNSFSIVKIDSNNQDNHTSLVVDGNGTDISGGAIQESKGVNGVGLSLSDANPTSRNSIKLKIQACTKAVETPNNVSSSTLSLNFNANTEDYTDRSKLQNNVSLEIDGINYPQDEGDLFQNNPPSLETLTFNSTKNRRYNTSAYDVESVLPPENQSKGLRFFYKNQTGSNGLKIKNSSNTSVIENLQVGQICWFVCDGVNWRSSGVVALV